METITHIGVVGTMSATPILRQIHLTWTDDNGDDFRASALFDQRITPTDGLWVRVMNLLDADTLATMPEESPDWHLSTL